MNTIRLRTMAPGLDFNTALDRAKKEAAARKDDPMLLAWYDDQAGRFSPSMTCCGGDDRVGCYAENRGSDLKVEVEGGKYVFYFR